VTATPESASALPPPESSGSVLVAARPSLIRAMNEQLLLEHIRQRGPCSRAELARVSGLSKPTVSAAVSRLEQGGLVLGCPPASRLPYELVIAPMGDEADGLRSELLAPALRLLADWGEGTSNATGGLGEGGGGPATTNDATWVHRFYSTQLWNTPGGDFAAAASATTTVSDIGNYSWSGAGVTARTVGKSAKQASARRRKPRREGHSLSEFLKCRVVIFLF